MQNFDYEPENKQQQIETYFETSIKYLLQDLAGTDVITNTIVYDDYKEVYIDMEVSWIDSQKNSCTCKVKRDVWSRDWREIKFKKEKL